MKKLLLFISILTLLSGCAYQEVSDNTAISQSVLSELKTATVDTVYVIKTDQQHYYFNTDKELVEVYVVGDNYIGLSVDVFGLILLIMIFIGAIIAGLAIY